LVGEVGQHITLSRGAAFLRGLAEVLHAIAFEDGSLALNE
jgi:hypothetical protein